MRIIQKTFLVSGGSSGLGFATAEGLINAGAFVAILDVVDSPLIHDHLKFFKTDVTVIDEIEQAVNQTYLWTQETGAYLGGVINCAGVGKIESTISSKGVLHTKESWDRTLAINLSGSFHVTRLALKYLIHSPLDESDGERGIIIMISSTVAYEGLPGQIAYAATKGAILSMTLPMARDLAKFDIRVVTLAPAPFDTPMMRRLPQNVLDEVHEKGLLYPKRMGFPHEFFATVKWAIECPFVNGESIKLTGGARNGYMANL